MVGSEIGQVGLGELQILVYPLDQPQQGDQPMHRRDPAETGGSEETPTQDQPRAPTPKKAPESSAARARAIGPGKNLHPMTGRIVEVDAASTVVVVDFAGSLSARVRPVL